MPREICLRNRILLFIASWLVPAIVIWVACVAEPQFDRVSNVEALQAAVLAPLICAVFLSIGERENVFFVVVALVIGLFAAANLMLLFGKRLPTVMLAMTILLLIYGVGLVRFLTWDRSGCC